MFLGSIPPTMRAIAREIVESWGVDELWNPCSGNFTFARTLPTLRHHGNDVTLYSSAMGACLAGGRLDVGLTEFGQEHVPWLADSLSTPEDTLATLMLGTRFFNGVGETNTYYERLVGAYRDQWENLHERTVEKVKALDLALGSFTCKGALEWLEEDVPADVAVVSYPPFIAGGYEDLDATLLKVVAWEPPAYTVLDEEKVRGLLGEIMSRKHWLLGVPERLEDLEEHLHGVTQTTNRGVPLYIYASSGPRRAVAPRQRVAPVPGPRITPETVLTGEERVSLARLDSGQFTLLRSENLSVRIAPSLPQAAFGMMLDGMLVGAFGVSKGTFKPGWLYLMSDFPLSSSRYTRLSALIAAVARSSEVKHLMERMLTLRATHISTTAFTDNVVSMKYRSAGFTLDSRKPGDDENKYQLAYSATVGEYTAQEAYTKWFRKHSRKVRSAA